MIVVDRAFARGDRTRSAGVMIQIRAQGVVDRRLVIVNDGVAFGCFLLAQPRSYAFAEVQVIQCPTYKFGNLFSIKTLYTCVTNEIKTNTMQKYSGPSFWL